MDQRKIFSGFFLWMIGTYCVLTGNTIAFERGRLFSNFDNDPVNFLIVVPAFFVFGLISLISGLFYCEEGAGYSDVFKDSDRYKEWLILSARIKQSAVNAGIVGFFSSFLVGMVALKILNIWGSECIICQESGDVWGVIFFSSMLHLPWVFALTYL